MKRGTEVELRIVQAGADSPRADHHHLRKAGHHPQARKQEEAPARAEEDLAHKQAGTALIAEGTGAPGAARTARALLQHAVEKPPRPQARA